MKSLSKAMSLYKDGNNQYRSQVINYSQNRKNILKEAATRFPILILI